MANFLNEETIATMRKARREAGGGTELSFCAYLIMCFLGESTHGYIWEGVFQRVRPFCGIDSLCAARRELLSLNLIEEDLVPDDMGTEPVTVLRRVARQGVQHGI